MIEIGSSDYAEFVADHESLKVKCDQMRKALDVVISKALVVIDVYGNKIGEVCFIDSFDFIREALRGERDE